MRSNGVGEHLHLGARPALPRSRRPVEVALREQPIALQADAIF
jgi:hypothetical protein